MEKTAEQTEKRKHRKHKPPREVGFLGFKTNTFDRYFLSVVLAIAVGLVHLRLFEPLGLPSFVPWTVSVLAAFLLIRKG
jgi:predicted small integral membrane protein